MWNTQNFVSENNQQQHQHQQLEIPYYNKEEHNYHNQNHNPNHNHQTFDSVSIPHTDSYAYIYGENYSQNNMNTIYEREADINRSSTSSSGSRGSNSNSFPTHYQEANTQAAALNYVSNPDQTAYNSYTSNQTQNASNNSNEIMYQTLTDCSPPATTSSNSSSSLADHEPTSTHFISTKSSYDTISSPSKSPCITELTSNKKSCSISPITQLQPQPQPQPNLLPTTIILTPQASSLTTTTTTTITAAAAVAVSLINTNDPYANQTSWNNDFYANNTHTPTHQSNSNISNSYNSYAFNNDVISNNQANCSALDFSSAPNVRTKPYCNSSSSSSYELDTSLHPNTYLMNQYASNSKSFQSNLAFNDLHHNCTGNITNNSNNNISNNSSSSSSSNLVSANSNGNNTTTLIKETFTISTNRNRLTANYPTNSIMFTADQDLELMHNTCHHLENASDYNQNAFKSSNRKNYSGN